tara:strand:- start:6356 stop:7297 length:942 start_codon:yes stop_codon:yes gene_type:complete
MKKIAPVVLFTYNRFEETQQTVEALRRNYLAGQTRLFIFSDGAKDSISEDKVKEVRLYLKTISGFKSVEIFESTCNRGLANSIIYGVSKIIEIYETVIVLEDDLITTPNFLDFMNEGLRIFKDNSQVYAINGYSLNIDVTDCYTHYFHVRAFPWGWATWKNNWNGVNFDKLIIKNQLDKNPEILKDFESFVGADSSEMLISSINSKNNSWYIRWVFDNFLKNKVSVFPISSKIINIGFSEDATHCDGISVYNSNPDKKYLRALNFDKELFLRAKDPRFLKYFSMRYKILYRAKLLFKSNGASLVFKEIKNKFK